MAYILLLLLFNKTQTQNRAVYTQEEHKGWWETERERERQALINNDNYEMMIIQQVGKGVPQSVATFLAFGESTKFLRKGFLR